MTTPRALITRPRAEAEALAALLARGGMGAVLEPMIEIFERRAPRLVLVGVQAILCTSANGVRSLARASTERGVPVFAVGDATAREARAAGFGEVASAGGAVEDLARLVGRRLCPSDGRLLHAAGGGGAGALAGLLGAEGFMFERVILDEARASHVLSVATVRMIDGGE